MIYCRASKAFVLLAVLWGGLFIHGISAQEKIHVVVKGDTIYSLSRSYQVSQDELMRYNNIADASRLQVGARLNIPSAAGSPSPPAVRPAAAGYTVSQNETLYSIARAKGVTLQSLRDINGFSKTYVLKAGEKIKIPEPAPAPAAASVKAPPKEPARAAAKIADPSIRWPVTAKEVLYMSGAMGVLVSGDESESVKSLTRGTVVYASPWRGYGNVAIVESDGGYKYLYGACESLSVRKGDSIEPGTELGKLGIYPASGRPDLVFVVSQNGSPIDPAKAPRF
ncbi:MAG: M23 family metallopeptidase [Treponema sp.]|nr:M23 family metallopeptidase [Treponema sp.]